MVFSNGVVGAKEENAKGHFRHAGLQIEVLGC
jgi:hypothetical protein